MKPKPKVFFKWRQLYSGYRGTWAGVLVPHISEIKKLGYKSYKKYLEKRLEFDLNDWSEHYRGFQAIRSTPTKEWLMAQIEDAEDQVKYHNSAIKEYRNLMRKAKPEKKKKQDNLGF